MTRSVFVLVALGLTGCWIGGGGSYDRYDGYDGYDPSRSTGTPTTGTSTPPRDTCVDPNGFGGHGCYRCKPTTMAQLLAACTDAKYETFDNEARIPGYTEGAPLPEIADQGPELPAFDPGPSETPDTTVLPTCSLASLRTPVLVYGATGFPMETLAKAMGTAATIVFREAGSCEGVASVVLKRRIDGPVTVYSPNGDKSRCVLSEPQPADLALSALFASSCGGQADLAGTVTLPTDIDDLIGPVSPVMFATPATSKERAISAEAAYRVFGMASSGVTPWNDESSVFRRRASSGNQQTVARTLGLPADKLRGRDSNGSSAMLPALLSTKDPSKTIGISSSEIVDTNPDALKALAYRHLAQPVAFYPDSVRGSLDRRNVRDGHYVMWNALHVLVRTQGGEPIAAPNDVRDPSGTAKAELDAAVKRLAYVMVSRQEAPVRGVDLFGAMKRVGNVPACAMKVRRSSDGANITPHTPELSCGCAFEAAAPTTTRSECTPCRDSSQCTGAKSTCSFGYCE